MRQRQSGFTLVELLVVIAIIGTLVALLLPAVQAARETARGNTCRNSIRQLMTALTNFDTTQRKLPGYVNEIFDPTSIDPVTKRATRGRRASWIVMTFPYMELTPLWDRWSQDFSNNFTTLPDGAASIAPAIEGLTCPSNVPETQGQPWLAYVGNAGWAFSDPDRGADDQEHAANGVFFDNSRNLGILESSAANNDGREGDPEIRMSMNYISSNDGTSKTLMISESLHTWYYAYSGGGATDTDFVPGFTATKDVSPIKDAKHIFGFVWKIAPVGIERINGDKYSDKAALPASMAEYADLVANADPVPNLYESYGFPSSGHPGGVNVAFCGGQVQFMADTIDPRVYAMLMTSNRNRSNYEFGGTPDRKLNQPADGDY